MAPVYYAMTILIPDMNVCSCKSFLDWKLPVTGCEAECKKIGGKGFTAWGDNLDLAT